MARKRICVLSAQVPFMKGGAELMVDALTKQLRIRGYDAELIQLPFKWYPCNDLLDSTMIWKLLDLSEANGEKIDLVIATKFPTYLIEHKNKVLWLMHQHRVAYDLYDNKQYAGLRYMENGEHTKHILEDIDTKSINSFNSRYTISKNVADRLKKYNGIDSTPLYHPPALVGRYYCNQYEDYIISVGRLDAIKRNDMLIRSLPLLDKNIKVYIAGKGTELEKLQQLASELKVEDRVNFLGFVNDEDLLKLYANAFAVYFAPIDEDYGYITLEAFLSKKPVITCNDSGGVLEFVRNEENGYICETNIESIAENINQLYYKKELCKEFGNSGYEKVKAYSWDTVIEQLTKTL